MSIETSDTLELDGFEDDTELPPVDTDDDDGDDDDDAPDDAGENAVIRKMRADLREAKRRNAELERERKDAAKVVLGPKPTLEGCDWQDDKYEAALEKWTADKLTADKVEVPVDKGPSNFEASANAFQTARAALTAETPEAEDVILDVDRAFGVERSGFIIHAFKDKAPALMVAIGKNPALMDELADMDPVEMIVRVARMQTKDVKMARAKPDIDEPVQGKAPVARGADKKLAKLEADARASGDYSQVYEHKRRLRESGRA